MAMAASYVHCYLSIMYRKIGHSQIQNRPLARGQNQPAPGALCEIGQRRPAGAKRPSGRSGKAAGAFSVATAAIAVLVSGVECERTRAVQAAE